MPLYKAEIKARPKHFQVLHRATVIFEAETETDAQEQAQTYSDRLGMYDSCDVDSLEEIGGP